MKFKTSIIGLLGAAVIAGPVATAAAQEVVVPMLSYRTGNYAPNGIPFANGYRDYFALVNKRGGIGGVKIKQVECETGYKTNVGVECYERLKSQGAVIMTPLSTGITYKLIPKAPVDKIPVLSMGYGMSAAADGRYFPWVFNFPTTYWSQASAIIRYIGMREAGMDELKGKKIGFIFLESGYGREPIVLFKALAKKYGFKFTTWSVPGKSMQDQRAQWRKIQRAKPDWMIMWGWGAMNSTAIKRAKEFGFPLNRFIGGWWSGSEADAGPSGKAAKGYLAASFNPPGANIKVLQDVLKEVYGGDKAKAGKNNWSQVLYNRGLFNAALIGEAIRFAVKKYGKKVTGSGVREGLEALNLDAARLDALGFKGFTKPIKVTCADHEGSGPVLIQKWDGAKWVVVSDWISPMTSVVRPMLEAAAVKEAKKLGYKKRKC